MIEFWRLARATQPGQGGYFDETLGRALELSCALPHGSVEWVKSQWPGVEFYLYDTSEDDRLIRRVKSIPEFSVMSVRRPEDHGQMMECDWIVHVVAGDERGR